MMMTYKYPEKGLSDEKCEDAIKRWTVESKFLSMSLVEKKEAGKNIEVFLPLGI